MLNKIRPCFEANRNLKEKIKACTKADQKIDLPRNTARSISRFLFSTCFSNWQNKKKFERKAFPHMHMPNSTFSTHRDWVWCRPVSWYSWGAVWSIYETISGLCLSPGKLSVPRASLKEQRRRGTQPKVGCSFFLFHVVTQLHKFCGSGYELTAGIRPLVFTENCQTF